MRNCPGESFALEIISMPVASIDADLECIGKVGDGGQKARLILGGKLRSVAPSR